MVLRRFVAEASASMIAVTWHLCLCVGVYAARGNYTATALGGADLQNLLNSCLECLLSGYGFFTVYVYGRVNSTVNNGD